MYSQLYIPGLLPLQAGEPVQAVWGQAWPSINAAGRGGSTQLPPPIVHWGWGEGEGQATWGAETVWPHFFLTSFAFFFTSSVAPIFF